MRAIPFQVEKIKNFGGEVREKIKHRGSMKRNMHAGLPKQSVKLKAIWYFLLFGRHWNDQVLVG